MADRVIGYRGDPAGDTCSHGVGDAAQFRSEEAWLLGQEAPISQCLAHGCDIICFCFYSNVYDGRDFPIVVFPSARWLHCYWASEHA